MLVWSYCCLRRPLASPFSDLMAPGCTYPMLRRYLLIPSLFYWCTCLLSWYCLVIFLRFVFSPAEHLDILCQGLYGRRCQYTFLSFSSIPTFVAILTEKLSTSIIMISIFFFVFFCIERRNRNTKWFVGCLFATWKDFKLFTIVLSDVVLVLPRKDLESSTCEDSDL